MTSSLRRAALGWVTWAAVGRTTQRLFRTATRLILARLLWPEAFGLFALASIVVAAGQVLCQLQIPTTLVQQRAVTPRRLSTAHWSLVAFGGAGTLALALFAAPIAGLLGHRGVVPLLQVSALQLVLTAFSATARALLIRELAFKRMALRRFASDGASSAVAIGSALAGAGVWSLVIQELVADVADIVLLWRMVDWRPSWHWHLGEFRELLAFGSPLLGRSGFDYVANNGDRLLVGRAFGPEALGYYSLGLRLAEVFSDAVGSVFERVAFPAFARAREDLRRSRRGFLEATRIQALLIVPAVVATVWLARDLVPFLVGTAWSGAVPFTQILAARALLTSVLSLPRAALLGRGRQWLIALLSLSSAGVLALGWSLGLRWGPLGVAVGGTVAAFCLIPLSVWALRSELQLRLSALGRAFLPSVAGGAVMALTMSLTERLLPGLSIADRPIRIGVLVLAGGLGYLLVVAAWLRADLRWHAQLLRHGPPGPEAADLKSERS
jgi:teichuronic acid exporter